MSAVKHHGHIRLCRSANPLASSRCSSLVSRFVQLLDSVLCYLIPLSEDSVGTFNALRVSVCRGPLGWCRQEHLVMGLAGFAGVCGMCLLIR